jgi:hypothetical protein
MKYSNFKFYAATLLLATIPGTCLAEPFSIQAGPIDWAMEQWARYNHIQLIYSTDLIRGLTSPPVTGEHSALTALSMILSRTCLAPVYVNSWTITFVPMDPCRWIPTPTGYVCFPVGDNTPSTLLYEECPNDTRT